MSNKQAFLIRLPWRAQRPTHANPHRRFLTVCIQLKHLSTAHCPPTITRLQQPWCDPSVSGVKLKGRHTVHMTLQTLFFVVVIFVCLSGKWTRHTQSIIMNIPLNHLFLKKKFYAFFLSVTHSLLFLLQCDAINNLKKCLCWTQANSLAPSPSLPLPSFPPSLPPSVALQLFSPVLSSLPVLEWRGRVLWNLRPPCRVQNPLLGFLLPRWKRLLWLRGQHLPAPSCFGVHVWSVGCLWPTERNFITSYDSQAPWWVDGRLSVAL